MLATELFRKIRQIEIHTRKLVNDSYAGEYHAVFKGRGMEFEEVRPYIPGDEIRTIDWNVTARTGEPYVKRFVEERELTVMLVVDASGSGNFGSINRFKRELAAELTSLLLCPIPLALRVLKFGFDSIFLGQLRPFKLVKLVLELGCLTVFFSLQLRCCLVAL